MISDEKVPAVFKWLEAATHMTAVFLDAFELSNNANFGELWIKTPHTSYIYRMVIQSMVRELPVQMSWPKGSTQLQENPVVCDCMWVSDCDMSFGI